MAKATVSTLQGNYSDIVLGKVSSTDHGYNFSEVEVTLTAELKAGNVIKADGTALASGDDANLAYGVLVDMKTVPGAEGSFGMEIGTKYPMVLAVRGLTLNRKALTFIDGTAITDAVATAIEAKANLVSKHFFPLAFSGE